MHHAPYSALRQVAAAAALAALFGIAPAHAARTSAADATYQKDRAACLNGSSGQDRKTCLREAAAAHQEALRGELQTESAQTLLANKLKRCQVQPAGDARTDCERLARGEGIVEGSVAAGGDIKELVTVTVGPTPTPKN